jgi:hypothetical protein
MLCSPGPRRRCNRARSSSARGIVCCAWASTLPDPTIGSSTTRRWSSRGGSGRSCNAIGTALTEESPVQLFSAEHFESAQHPWYCSAVPVHDPHDGTLLGVVDISGPALTLHPAVRSLVTTAVRLAEARLMIIRQEQLNSLRDRMSAMLAGTPGPALVVDEAGWVAYQQGVRTRDRIETPAPDRSILIPGAGLCLPEKITGGWLLRPSSDGAGQAGLGHSPTLSRPGCARHRLDHRTADDPAHPAPGADPRGDHRGGACRNQCLAAQPQTLRGCRSPGHGPCRSLATAPVDRGTAGHSALPLGRGRARPRFGDSDVPLRSVPPAAKVGLPCDLIGRG